MKKNRIIFFTIFAIMLIAYCITDMDYPVHALWMMIIYLILARAVTMVSPKNLSVEFFRGTEGRPGEEIKTEFVVANNGFMPVLGEHMEIEVVNLLSEEQDVRKLCVTLLPKQKKRTGLSFCGECCGSIKIHLKNAYITDPLGIFTGKKQSLCCTDSTYVIMPEIKNLNIDRNQLDHYDMESYRYSQSVRGDDPSETFGIREYRQGDSIKSIHWKLSGKTGETVIREYGLPIDNRIFVIGDKQSFTEDNSIMEINEVTELYCSLLYTLSKSRISFNTGWFDYNRNEFVQKTINSIDDVYDIIPEILGCPFRSNVMSATAHFLEADIEDNYGLFIYVTSKGEVTERLREYGEVSIYRTEDFK